MLYHPDLVCAAAQGLERCRQNWMMVWVAWCVYFLSCFSRSDSLSVVWEALCSSLTPLLRQIMKAAKDLQSDDLSASWSYNQRCNPPFPLTNYSSQVLLTALSLRHWLPLLFYLFAVWLVSGVLAQERLLLPRYPGCRGEKLLSLSLCLIISHLVPLK